METIKIFVAQDGVWEEVAKATDYTGSKLPESDADTRDRILAADDDLANLERFWDEAAMAANEKFKEMLLSGTTTEKDGKKGYEAELEVSAAWDKGLAGSVGNVLRSYFIASIIGQWFKFANKGEAVEYLTQAAGMLTAAERLLYARRRPARPRD